MTHSIEADVRLPLEFGRSTSHRPGRRDHVAHGLLLLLAVWSAWFPLETRPWTAVVVAGVVLVLCTWSWRRGGGDAERLLATAAVVSLVLAASGLSGWDPARAVGEIGLLAAVAAMVWLSSRSPAPACFPTGLAVGLAGLAVWGLWQATVGLEAVRPELAGLPDTARAYVEERLASRRAFASLPLPSHLAVLLATALPLLLVRPRLNPTGVLRFIGATLCVIGLVATRSPVGVGLGLTAAAAVTFGRHRRLSPTVIPVLVAALAAVLILRPDVGRLEPLTLRFDNWRTAVWLWSTAPATGAGVASFAQATQGSSLEVGNRPAHAHSLPLESLAELGPVGLVACLVFGMALLHLVRTLWPREPGLAAAVAVVPVHNLIDFSFFGSGVALPWAVLVGWAWARSRDPAEDQPVDASRGRIVLVSAASIAFAATAFHATSIAVEESAAVSPDVAVRVAGSLRALELAPWRIEPQFLLASAALEAGRPQLLDMAWSELDRRRGWRPRSAALAERRARLALARGDPSLAAADLWAAVSEGSPDDERERALESLLTALDGGVGATPR